MHLDELTEEWPDELTPLPERNPLTPRQHAWASFGVVVERDVIAEEALTAYEHEWLAYNYESPGGWDYATPYMDYFALRRVVCDGNLARILEELTGEPMGVHLNLTGWTSTRRNWHRDQYLNEPYVGGFYAAVWLALDTVHPDAGPFEFIPHSHQGKPISQQKIRVALGEYGRGDDWPTQSERVLTPLFEDEITKTGEKKKQFLPKRGEILIWHGRLLHRGSVPRDPTLERRSLIAHYSGIHHRPDMPPAVQHIAGGWYFPLTGRTPTGYGLTS
jgi:hypothetical protein